MTVTKTMLTGQRILLVEDDFYIAEDMACQLEAGGAKVVGPVASVDAAIGLIEQKEPLDGAVVDVNLQGVMSWPIADALLRRGVPLVFATGYDRTSIPARYAGIVCCEKPCNFHMIGGLIRLTERLRLAKMLSTLGARSKKL